MKIIRRRREGDITDDAVVLWQWDLLTSQRLRLLAVYLNVGRRQFRLSYVFSFTWRVL